MTPWGSVPRVVAAAGVALGVGLAVPLPAVAQAVLATLVYGVALVAVRRFPPELRTAVALRRYGAVRR